MPRTCQTDADDPNRTLRAPRRELWYPPSNAMGRFNEAADPQMALAARAERPLVLRWHTDLKIALPGLEEDQRGEARLRPYRLWRDGLHRPSHRRISGDVLSRRRCSVLGDRGTLDRQAPEGACRDRRAERSAFGEGGRRRVGESTFDVRACGRDYHDGRALSAPWCRACGGLRGHGHGLC